MSKLEKIKKKVAQFILDCIDKEEHIDLEDLLGLIEFTLDNKKAALRIKVIWEGKS